MWRFVIWKRRQQQKGDREGIMAKSRFFPSLVIQKHRHGCEAIAGIRLKSILKENLHVDLLKMADRHGLEVEANYQKKLHQSREAMLLALSAWPDNAILEMRLSSMPNLAHRAQGNVSISFLIRVTESNEEKAKEEAVARYLSMISLLSSFQCEAEFNPIIDEKELRTVLHPFTPRNALTVQRHEEEILLTAPFKRRIIGLLNGRIQDDEGYHVKYRYPWVPSLSDWSGMLSALMNALDPVQMIVRLRKCDFDGPQKERMENSIRSAELYLATGDAAQVTLRMQANMIRNAILKRFAELSDTAFNLSVFILAAHPIDVSLGSVLGQGITARRVAGDEQSLFQGGFQLSGVAAAAAMQGDYFHDKDAYSVSEAACAFRLPSPPMQVNVGLPVRGSRTKLAIMPMTTTKEKRCMDLFVNEHNNICQPVMLPNDDRMRHTFIIGQTGTGKSTLMESMILQDIRAGEGLAVIDPHGDMIDSILGKIPENRASDVILFDVLDREKPIGFNMLQWRTLDERDFVIDEIYNSLDHMYDMKQTGGPVFESNLRGMLKLMMGDDPESDFKPTILEFMSCYLQSDFRRWLKDRSRDPINLDFISELERTGGDACLRNIAPYITSKFGRFTNDSTLMHIIGQEKTPFSFDDIMNQGKIFLVKLGKGRFGSTVSNLLANMIVAKFKHAAMRRGDMNPKCRRDFYMYIDECQNLPSENFTELLAEARKYRMGLVLATQYTAQLSGESQRKSLLSAIIGNVGTLIMFRLGQEDARHMEPVLAPTFSFLDIVGLPNWHGYARLQIGGAAVAPFSFRSVKDESLYSESRASQIRSLSRSLYGGDRKFIGQRILERRNIWKEVKCADELNKIVSIED
jgi:hypothetical protein